MNDFEEDHVSMPVSPMAHYFNSSVLSVFVLGVLESEIPIDDSRAVPLLREVFLPLNKRFSSIMIEDKKGQKQWKQVYVNIKEHIKIPIFPTNNTPLKLYDEYFDEYMTKLAMEQLPQDKPLWEMHIIKYPTSSAAGTFIFKLHHALGDGYTLMATLLACVQNADNPSVPIKFPSSRRVVEPEISNKTMLKRLHQTVSMVYKSALDFGWSILKGSLMADDRTPIRSGHEDVEFRPIAFTNVSISLDSLKEVKNKLKVSINDALVGIVFLGVRLYMGTTNHKPTKAQTTGMVLLNTRKIRGYQSVKEMLDTNSDAPWGNRFYFMHIPIPELSTSNPLEFVLEANKNIMRTRYSLVAPLHGVLLGLLKKIKGPEAVASYIRKNLNNSSVSISHMVGPLEQVALGNHPIKGLYFMTIGLCQSITVTIASYNGYVRVGFGVEKGFIDVHQFKSCFETSLEMILKAARNIATETK